MDDPKAEGDYHAQISIAIENTVGKRNFTSDSYFKKDLGLSSIDLIDFFFELERTIGRKIDARQLLLALIPGSKGKDDLTVGNLVQYLKTLGK